MPVKFPDLSPKRGLARRLFDAAVSEIPIVGGAMAAIYGLAFPSHTDRETERWQREITDFVNDHEAILGLARNIPFSDDAANLGAWFARESKLARGEQFDYDNLKEAFPDAEEIELRDALGELQASGFVEIPPVLGATIKFIQPTSKLYEVFDPVVFDGRSPRLDAATLGRLLLQREALNSRNVDEELGWGTRRMNPALTILGQNVGENRKSREMGKYVIAHFFVIPEDRARVRRFVDTVEGKV